MFAITNFVVPVQGCSIERFYSFYILTLASLTDGEVGSVGEDVPPLKDEAGVTAPDDEERDALLELNLFISSSPNNEFRPNEIPFVIFK